MTPVEHMARAICRADHPCWSMVNEIMDMPSYRDGREGDAGALTHAGVYRERAQAALKAIREPSKAMIEAGRIPTREIDLGNGTTATGLGLGADPESIWKRMIDAALSET